MSPTAEDESPRAGRCAIVGRPNVGKSTLLNALVGQKLAITTSRPGTTRSLLLGVHASASPRTQIAFVDTPGMGLSKSVLHASLSQTAKAGLSDADVVLLVTDAVPKTPEAELHEGDLAVLAAARETGRPIVVAVNKVDTVAPRPRLLPVIEKWSAQAGVSAVVPISATKRDNLAALLGELRAHLPEGVLYEEDFVTDRPVRFFAAELVREAVIRHVRDEVPHGVAVILDSFEEEPELVRIHATIVVEKPSHKGIVVGKGGATLKRIGIEARKAIEALVERKVFLQTWVKVVEGWTRDPARVRELGEPR
jgi:GTP-binding protein Era